APGALRRQHHVGFVWKERRADVRRDEGLALGGRVIELALDVGVDVAVGHALELGLPRGVTGLGHTAIFAETPRREDDARLEPELLVEAEAVRVALAHDARRARVLPDALQLLRDLAEGLLLRARPRSAARHLGEPGERARELEIARLHDPAIEVL